MTTNLVSIYFSPTRSVTEGEFLEWMREFEQLNSSMTWRQLATYLHAQFYYFDLPTVILGIPLFQHGLQSQDAGDAEWKTPPPKWLTAPYGKIDLAHSYAALRAILDRGLGSGWAMSLINTYLGDLYQEFGVLTFAAKAVPRAKGAVRQDHLDYVKDVSGKFMPRDQAAGNFLGLLMVYEMSHCSRLSEGYARALRWFTTTRELPTALYGS
jgi:hypothetical protein